MKSFNVTNKKENHVILKFGCYLKRKRQNKVMMKIKNHFLTGFFNNISQVNKYVSNVYKQVCSEETR